MTDKEIMQQALDTLETKGEHHPKVYEAIIALRSRLAQDTQKPADWVYLEGLEALQQGKPWTAYGIDGEGRIPLYTSAQQHKPWVGLTPEDYDSMRPRVPYIVNDFTFADVAAIVEAKLKEKNK